MHVVEWIGEIGKEYGAISIEEYPDSANEVEMELKIRVN